MSKTSRPISCSEYTVCPRSLDLFYILSYCKKWEQTSLIYSTFTRNFFIPFSSYLQLVQEYYLHKIGQDFLGLLYKDGNDCSNIYYNHNCILQKYADMQP